MKKKLFSIMLSLALMVTMMPAQTLVVSAATKTKTTVSTQKGLKKALKNKKLRTISVKTSKAKNFTVPKGTHKKVHLVVDATKSTVKNKSVFKKITIKGIKSGTSKTAWTEYNKGNTLIVHNKTAKISVAKSATVKEIIVLEQDSNINFNVTGTLKKVTVEESSTITINGSSKKAVEVNIKNEDSVVKVINNTDTIVKAKDSNGKVVEVKDGGTEIIGGNTPSPTPTPAPTKYTVAFNLNDISGTAPTSQMVEKNGKVIKPTDPTDTIHTFAGWYKTKDATTGELSDKWNFNTDAVTENMTLYAQWTRTLESILSTNDNVPKSTDDNPPDNAWVNGSNPNAKAYIGVCNSENRFYFRGAGSNGYYFYMNDEFTKTGNNYIRVEEKVKATCYMENTKFASVNFVAINQSYELYNGTYAPVVSVISVSIDLNTLELLVGDEQKLNATVLPENATNKNVTWNSNNTDVATVDASGNVTAVAAGQATITVTTVDGSKTATCTVTVKAPTFKAVYNTTGGANTLTFYYDVVDHSGNNITVYDNLPTTSATESGSWPYNNIRDNIKSVVIDSSVANYKGLTSTAGMFSNMKYAQSIRGTEYLDVSNVTNMWGTFNSFGYFYTELNTVPNVSNWNTGKVTNMTWMFRNYGGKSTVLEFNLDLSGWNVANVTSFDQMFFYERNDEIPSTWNVTIPAKTGAQANETTKWYVGDGADSDKYITPASGKQFTLAAPEGFVDLGVTNASSEPVYWAKCNLGATSPDSNGDYFAWGETSPYYTTTGGWPTNLTWKTGKEGGYAWQSYCGEGTFTEWSTPPYDSSNKVLLPAFDAATVANPDWHTPTAEDFTKLAANCVWEWTTDYNGTGKSGYIVYKAKNEEDKGHANMNGTWKEWDTTQSKFVNNTGSTPSGYILSDVHIFLPVGGFGNGTSLTSKSYAYYWSSTLNSEQTSLASSAFDLNFYSTNINAKIQAKRSNGYNIRPVTE